MPWDDDADDDAQGSGPPLPPDDRLWRHPSEVGRGAVGPQGQLGVQAPGGRAVTWPMALAAGLVGATLSAALIAATGSLPGRVVERQVVEKVAVTPIVSSPMVGGERGVAAVAEQLAPAIARLELDRDSGPATGSAVLFRDDGLLLTSAQLLTDVTGMTVVLTDGRTFEGRLLGFDRVTDVAVIAIDGDDLPIVVIGSSSGVRVGAPTVAIGHPSGVDHRPEVATGVVSAVRRRFDSTDGRTLHGMIQVDVPIAPAVAGGALVDANGAVIGITTAMVSEAGDRFGFAIPIDLAHRVAADLVDDGHAAHSWLGVRGADLTRAQIGAMGVAGGAMLRDVTDGSPAAAAGLAPDDVITEVDGEEVESISGLVVELRERRPGDEVVVGYWRDGRHEETTVVLGERG